MLDLWPIDDDLIDKTYRGNGKRFRALMDRLIEASAGEFAIDADRWIIKNVKDEHNDGGVDTQVDRGWPRERSGYLRRKSVWQYSSGGWKETRAGHFKRLLRKPYLLAQLRAGYSLRVCVPEPKPVRDVNKQTGELRKLLASIDGVPISAVRDFQILDGNRITQWLNRHWALLREHHRDAFAHLLSLDEWGSELRKATRQYVEVPEWQDVRTRILAHVDFARLPPSAVLQVSGPAGAGKTRFVLETLAEAGSGMESRVGYLESASDALALARQLGREQRRGILVVDECDATGREQLAKVVYAFLEHIRVITIDNSGEPRQGDELVLGLDRMNDRRLRAVLSANFPDVPGPRLEEICAMANGFVRWGVTLCQQRPTVHLPADARDYLDKEFRDPPRRRALLALSLVTHILYGEHVRAEHDLDEGRILVEALFGRDYASEEFHANAFAIHASHGFVHRGSQVLYLTPQLFVAPLFIEAWNRHIKHRMGAFFRALATSPVLQDRLLRRYRQLPAEARKECAGIGECFRGEVVRVSARSLIDAAAVRRLAWIVEMDPDLYLPALRERIATLDPGILRGIAGESSMFRKPTDPDWGPRRYLVWLAERLASFARWFHDAAEILLHLAVAENENRVANNATGIWRQLHRIHLSGTELSYHQRVRALRARVRDASPEIALLLVTAASEAFEMRGMRRMQTSPIAGLPAPADWEPASGEEYRECLEEAMALLEELANRSTDARQAVRCELHENVAFLASHGLTRQARRILGDLSDEEAARARRDLRHVIEHEKLDDPERTAAEDWVSDLTPKTLRQRVMESLHGASFWQKSDPEETLALARSLLESPQLLQEVIGLHPVPASGRARALGEALGLADLAGVWLDAIGRDALERGGVSLLATGYVAALAQRGAVPREFIQRLRTEPAPPQPVLSLLLLADAVEEAVDYVLIGLRGNQVSPATVDLLEWDVRRRRIGEVSFAAVIRGLLEFGTPAGTQVAVSLLHAWLGVPPATETALCDHGVAEAAWEVATSWARLEDHDSVARHNLEAYEWSQVMKELLALDAPRACAVLADALVRGRGLGEIDRDLVRRVAREHGPLLLERVIDKMLSIGRETLGGGDVKGVLDSIPFDELAATLDKHGVAAARLLAQHLPRPSIADGRGVMPPATRLVLERFGRDARVMGAFTAGLHTGVWARSPSGLAEHHRQIAEAFLQDPHPAIRQWAARELRWAREDAERWRAKKERDEVEAG